MSLKFPSVYLSSRRCFQIACFIHPTDKAKDIFFISQNNQQIFTCGTIIEAETNVDVFLLLQLINYQLQNQ